MQVLVINAGSSSMKYQLINMANGVVLAKGNCSRIGIDGLLEHRTHDGRKMKEYIDMKDHSASIQIVLELLTDGEYAVIKSLDEISAVGHRIVHGGEHFKEAAVVTDEVVKEIEAVIPLAPLHNPGSVTGIKACRQALSNVTHVVVFDTAFHQTMPRKAYIYAVPYEYYTDYSIRRYGFHGTSHRYLSQRLAALMNKPVSELKIVTCHLGNGSSVTAVDGGKSVDTSMGFTPLAGVPMGTRSGTIDPSVVTYIMEKEGFSPDQMSDFLNKQCGFLGVSGISSDSCDLEDAVRAGSDRARLAQEIFRYEIKKYIGGYAVAMGGLDAIVFSGGIGENNVEIRTEVLEGFAFMGAGINEEKNRRAVKGVECDISSDDAKIRTYVIPTNEEYMIAKDTLHAIGLDV